jgi:MYXO-CTERM domain-containing protein
MKLRILAVGVAMATLVSYSASAVTLNSVYTGATPNSVLSYDFTGGVLELTVTGTSLTEFVSDWGFDIDGTTTGWSIESFSGVADPTLVSPSHPSLNPLNFNLSFAFQNPAGDGRFQAGDSIRISLPSVTAITGSGAHVQGIEGGLSGKVSVPEPSAALAGLVALGMGAALRRRMA